MKNKRTFSSLPTYGQMDRGIGKEMQTTEEKYPELDKIATEIVCTVLAQCNSKTRDVKSEMPYKAQCVLEMVIAKLEKAV